MRGSSRIAAAILATACNSGVPSEAVDARSTPEGPVTAPEPEGDPEAKAASPSGSDVEAEREAEGARPEPASAKARPAPAEPAPMSDPDPEYVVLPAPPFAYTLRAEAPVKHQGPMPTLAIVSSKRNGIIDEEAWFRTNKLSLPLWTLPPRAPSSRPRRGLFRGGGPSGPIVPLGGSGDPLPPEIPSTFGGREIGKAIKGTDASIVIHYRGSPTLVVVRDALGEALGAYDFSEYGRASDVNWADVQDGVLYACTSNLFYAADSGGRNAFITAIEIGSGELLWQSEPLVCNSHSFVLRDGWIITGYGYTAEPDFLFVLDMKTGVVVQRLPVKSGPDVIIEKGGKLYVRTYDRDYVLAFR
jgi:hypothetical protein